MNLKNASFFVAVVALAMTGGVGAATMGGRHGADAGVATAATKSGLPVGERMLAFETKHVTGPDNGTDTCPICKYGTLPGVMVFVHGEDNERVLDIATKLDKTVADSKKDLHAFVVVLTDDKEDEDMVRSVYGDKFKHVAVTYLPATDSVIKAYKVDLSPKTRTTALVYRKMKVTESFVNLGDKKGSVEALLAAAKRVDAAG
ncbi:MAG: hypothetical protein JSS65_13990 [Armatimonadetes bacterium]|nr:hypothetical protein [Armatimonadota bacterium]